MKVRCPKCGEKFEIQVPVIQAPKDKILTYETTTQASPEAAKLWEKRRQALKR